MIECYEEEWHLLEGNKLKMNILARQRVLGINQPSPGSVELKMSSRSLSSPATDSSSE